jgi:hypothetical protein
MPTPPSPRDPTPEVRGLRFEATVHPGDEGVSLERVADLDLDRVPDPAGGIRVLVTAEDAAQLVERGYEVRLVRTHPVRPLDAGVVIEEDRARAWLEEQTRGIERREGS